MLKQIKAQPFFEKNGFTRHFCADCGKKFFAVVPASDEFKAHEDELRCPVCQNLKNKPITNNRALGGKTTDSKKDAIKSEPERKRPISIGEISAKLREAFAKNCQEPQYTKKNLEDYRLFNDPLTYPRNHSLMLKRAYAKGPNMHTSPLDRMLKLDRVDIVPILRIGNLDNDPYNLLYYNEKEEIMGVRPFYYLEKFSIDEEKFENDFAQAIPQLLASLEAFEIPRERVIFSAETTDTLSNGIRALTKRFDCYFNNVKLASVEAHVIEIENDLPYAVCVTKVNIEKLWSVMNSGRSVDFFLHPIAHAHRQNSPNSRLVAKMRAMVVLTLADAIKFYSGSRTVTRALSAVSEEVSNRYWKTGIPYFGAYVEFFYNWWYCIFNGIAMTSETTPNGGLPCIHAKDGEMPLSPVDFTIAFRRMLDSHEILAHMSKNPAAKVEDGALPFDNLVSYMQREYYQYNEFGDM